MTNKERWKLFTECIKQKHRDYMKIPRTFLTDTGKSADYAYLVLAFSDMDTFETATDFRCSDIYNSLVTKIEGYTKQGIRLEDNAIFKEITDSILKEIDILCEIEERA